MPVEKILILVFSAIGFLLLGYFLKSWIDKRKKENIQFQTERMIFDAEKEAMEIIESARNEGQNIVHQAVNDVNARIQAIEREKERLLERERILDEAQKNILVLNEENRQEREKIQEEKIYLRQKIREEILLLEEISGINPEEAREMIFRKIEEENAEDLYVSLRRLEKERKRMVEEKGKEILASVIQKYAGEINHSLVSTVVELKDDDEKGKVIGREGRNIRTFERVTGVQLVIDDTPEVITISSFDPIRREIAARVLNKILSDGIVQPARIEEYYEESKDEVEKILLEKGYEALEKIGLYDVDEELVELLGRLHFRTSFGQNVLQHSVEVAKFAEMLANELGVNPNVAKIAGLFHDIGKALDHEEEGSHVEIGIRILKRFGFAQEIIDAMKSHHREYPNENLESYIVDAADKISASRVGARSGMAENFLKKIEGLEKITSEFKGVNEAYAISAGREIRVFVKPDEVNDYLAQKMARQIAQRIEDELKYPGEIKVAVIREKRIIEYAR